GQHPEASLVQLLSLRAEIGSRSREGGAVGADPEKRDNARLVLSDLRFEQSGTLQQLLRGQLVRRGGRPRPEGWQAEVEPHQRGILIGRQQTRGEAAGVKSGPEAIAGTAEVMTDRRGVEARVDPAEQHLQPWTDYVGDRPPVCRGDLFARRPGSLA